MTGIILIVYAVIGLVSAYFVGGYAAWDSATSYQTKLDSGDIGFGIFIGIVTLFLWPIAIPWVLIYDICQKQRQLPIFWKPPEVRQRIAAERKRQEEQERRRLEAELLRETHEHGKLICTRCGESMGADYWKPGDTHTCGGRIDIGG